MSLALRERALYRTRSRSRFVRVSNWALGGLLALTWLGDTVEFQSIISSQRVQNLQRFLQEDLTPWALRQNPESFSWGDWILSIWNQHGADGLLLTLLISFVSIALAGGFGWLVAPFGARNLMHQDPLRHGLQVQTEKESRVLPWICQGTRLLQIFMRAIPEYIWAFLFLAMLGLGAWPAILALAIHNAGILGRLGAETIENLESKPSRGLFQLGASRSQVVISSVFAQGLPRYALFLFYRWETCVREATVLGMIGVLSLGYWIDDARVRQHYDEMLVLILFGALLILLGDLVSHLVRKSIR